MGPNIDFLALDEDASFSMALTESVWLMDDHKWAFLVWEAHKQKTNGQSYALLHADFHWDGIDDFHENVDAQRDLAVADLGALHAMVEEDAYIRYDSFIAPAVRRGTLSELHFFCLQDDGGDKGVDIDLCEQFGIRQVHHENVQTLAAVVPEHPLIFDLCLDLFNRSNMYYQGELWDDAEIEAFLESIRHHVRLAELVTISLSFGCSGTKEDTRYLAELVVPRVLEMRG